MLTGLLAPTPGSIRILGEDLRTKSAELKRQIGVVPEGMALLGRLTANEYLRFVGAMYGLDRATTLQRTEELLEFMNLAGERKKLVTDFSHGMQKKLALAAAVIHVLWQFLTLNGISVSAGVPTFNPSTLLRFPLRFGRYLLLRTLLGLMTPMTIVGTLAVRASRCGRASSGEGHGSISTVRLLPSRVAF